MNDVIFLNDCVTFYPFINLTFETILDTILVLSKEEITSYLPITSARKKGIYL